MVSSEKCVLIKNAGSCEEAEEISPLSYLYTPEHSTQQSSLPKKNYTPAETGLNNRNYDLKYNYRQPFRNLLKEDV
jgi:hypothetical protein